MAYGTPDVPVRTLKAEANQRKTKSTLLLRQSQGCHEVVVSLRDKKTVVYVYQSRAE